MSIETGNGELEVVVKVEAVGLKLTLTKRTLTFQDGKLVKVAAAHPQEINLAGAVGTQAAHGR